VKLSNREIECSSARHPPFGRAGKGSPQTIHHTLLLNKQLKHPVNTFNGNNRSKNNPDSNHTLPQIPAKKYAPPAFPCSKPPPQPPVEKQTAAPLEDVRCSAVAPQKIPRPPENHQRGAS